MQEGGLPPPHPSLPPVPRQNAPPTSYYLPQASYSSHYAQAYMQSSAPTTSDSYALSPTWDPSAYSAGPSAIFQPSAAWFQPGSCRCTYTGCNFIASHKALETHMMDRHLIYPPGWEKRQKKPDWDADPSLKGKPIPIQGTGLMLDKPEDLESWLAERKKRWPTTSRVEEQKRKMDEAVARGQLPLGASNPRKRQRTEDPGKDHGFGDRGRGRGRGGNHGRGEGRASDSGWKGRGRGGMTSINTREPSKGITFPQKSPPSIFPSVDPDGDEDEDAPEVISSKRPAESTANVGKTPNLPDAKNLKHDTAKHSAKNISITHRQPIKLPPQPKKEPHNPFASRPTLLRNLLLPEIRMTISNLSQAIRFLVDNDFLQDVEAKLGGNDEKLIQIIAENLHKENANDGQ